MGNPIVLKPGLVMVRPQYTPDPDTGNHPSNVLWFVQRAPTSLTLANLQTIAAAFDPLWNAVGHAYMGSGPVYLGSLVTDMSAATGFEWDSRGTWSGAAPANGESLPLNVAILISLTVQLRWRGGHPRIYLPYVGNATQDTVDPSKMKSTYQGTISAAFNLVEPGMNSIGVGGGLSQRIYLHRTDPARATLMQISSFGVNLLYATQRRRLRKAPHH